jgi:hypothetical protein
MMTDVRCTTQMPDVPGLEPQQLTVGRHFFLNCEGTWNRQFDFSKAQLVLENPPSGGAKPPSEVVKTPPTVARVFKVEARDMNSFDVDLTLYATGNIRFTDFVLSDGEIKLSLGPQSFTVVSVLEKTKEMAAPQAQAPESKDNSAQAGSAAAPQPFGYTYFKLPWPTSYSMAAAVLIFVLLLTGVTLFIRRWRQRKLWLGLKNFDSPLTPDIQFYRELRKLEKRDYPLDDVERLCQIYVVRTFEIPMFEVSPRQVVGFLKKRHPHLKEERRLLYQILMDFGVLRRQSSVDDRRKLLAQFYRFMELAQRWKQQVRNG